MDGSDSKVRLHKSEQNRSVHRNVLRSTELEEAERILSDSLKKSIEMVLLQPDPFLNELTSMYERSTEKGSVWVTLKRSSMKSKVNRNKMVSDGEAIEYRCLVRATDAKKTISTVLSAREHQKFQASFSTVLKAHMSALKKRERKDKKKTAEVEQKPAPSKKSSSKKQATSKPSS